MAGEKYGPTASGLEAALIALGSTPDAVAKTLEERGYRGVRGLCSICPVAEYLRDVTGREVEVKDGSSALNTGRASSGDLRWIEVDNPAAVAEFVRAFDYGAYEGLVRP